jgi:hypothetical protein
MRIVSTLQVINIAEDTTSHQHRRSVEWATWAVSAVGCDLTQMLQTSTSTTTNKCHCRLATVDEFCHIPARCCYDPSSAPALSVANNLVDRVPALGSAWEVREELFTDLLDVYEVLHKAVA